MTPRPVPRPFPGSLLQQARRAYSYVARPLVAATILRRTASLSVGGIRLTVPPGVFHPGLFGSSRFLARCVQRLDLAGKAFLDMGAGSGVIGILAERQGASVTAVDITLEAVRSAGANARTNGCRSFTALQSDLFEGLPAGSSFDLIAWNPPFYPGEPRTVAQHAWYAGEGYHLLRRFARKAHGFLAPGGSILLALSSDLDLSCLLLIFQEEGWCVSLEQAQRGLMEDLLLFRAGPS